MDVTMNRRGLSLLVTYNCLRYGQNLIATTTTTTKDEDRDHECDRDEDAS